LEQLQALGVQEAAEAGLQLPQELGLQELPTPEAVLAVVIILLAVLVVLVVLALLLFQHLKLPRLPQVLQ
jgi:hypothetical protein